MSTGTPLPYRLHRSMYRTGRPNALARALNQLDARQYGAGLLDFFGRGVRLDVRSRRTGRVRSVPLVLVQLDGERYLVSMLGPSSGWLLDARADGGRAVLRRRRGAEQVRLVPVDPTTTAAILHRYVEIAPGARAHLPFDRRSSLAQISAVAAQVPVLRVEPAPDEPAA